MPPSSGRVTRGAAAAADDLASLNARDRLIFAQAVYEHGGRPGTWAEIAKLLSSHPLTTKTKHSFTAQSCSALHTQLMKEAGLDWWAQTCFTVGRLSESWLQGRNMHGEEMYEVQS